MRRKKWAAAAAILLAGAMLAGALAWFALPSERVRTLVAAQLQTALGHPVTIAAVRVQFAPLLIRASGVRVAAPAGFASPDLLCIRSLELQPRILPLVRRRIAVRRIRIAGPELWCEQQPGGTWNWTPQAGEAPVRAAPNPAGSKLALAVDRIDLEAGQLHFASARTAVAATTPFAAAIALAADRELRDVRVSGWAEAESIATGGKLRGAHLGRIRLEPDLQANVPDSSVTLRQLRVWINDAPVDVAGTLRMAGGKPEFHLTSESPGLDLAKLLAALPQDAPQTAGLRAAGSVRFDLRVDAPAGAKPVTRGFVELRDGVLQAAGLPERISQLGARLELAGDSLHLAACSARIGRAPVSLSGWVLDTAAPGRTHYDLRLGAELDLAEVARVVPLEPGTALAGVTSVDVRVRGRTARPDSVFLDGPVTLRDVLITTPRLRLPVRARAALRGAGTTLRIEEATVQAGSSSLALTGAITPALPPRRVRLVLAATADRIDLAALLPPAALAAGTAAKAAGQGPAPALVPVLPAADYELKLAARDLELEAATCQGVRAEVRGGPQSAEVIVAASELRADQTVLRNAEVRVRVEDQKARGTLRAERALLQKIEATALASDLDVEGTTVRLGALQGAVYGGPLRGKAAVEFADPAHPRYDLDVKATGIDANGFLGGVTPLRNVVDGTLDLESAWTFSGPDPAIVRRTLSGSGRAASLNGRLRDLPVLDELARTLQLPELRTLPYRDLGLRFAVENGRMTLENSAIHSSQADLGVAGGIGLDGGLDLTLDVQLSADLSRRALAARGAGSLAALFADPEGRLVFDVQVGGTGRTPRLQLNIDKTRARAGLTAMTESAAQRVLGKLLGSGAAGAGAPGAQTPAVPATEVPDAGRKALESARKKLGGKPGGLLGGPAKSDSTHKN